MIAVRVETTLIDFVNKKIAWFFLINSKIRKIFI